MRCEKGAKRPNDTLLLRGFGLPVERGDGRIGGVPFVELGVTMNSVGCLALPGRVALD